MPSRLPCQPVKLIHAIADNYATHKHPKVRAWLAHHPRWTFHFTPTSASWLNAVEEFFATLTKRRLKRGVFRSIVELQAAINRFLAEHNQDPKPFRWTKSPKKIIAAVKRGFQVLAEVIVDLPGDCARRALHRTITSEAAATPRAALAGDGEPQWSATQDWTCRSS